LKNDTWGRGEEGGGRGEEGGGSRMVQKFNTYYLNGPFYKKKYLKNNFFYYLKLKL
jgi:hypothetical protein